MLMVRARPFRCLDCGRRYWAEPVEGEDDYPHDPERRVERAPLQERPQPARLLYKYYPPIRLHVLKERQVWLIRPQAFNDPFELNPHFPRPDSSDPTQKKMVLDMNAQTIVVLSLSEVRDSLLMWAHYAKAHLGFVVGFSPEPFVDDSPHRRLVRVDYHESRPSKRTFGRITDPDLLYTKSLDWEHEQEWCYIDSHVSADGEGCGQDQRYPFRFGPDKVREVVIGARATKRFKKELLDCLTSHDYRHVDVFQAEPDAEQYRLRLTPVGRPTPD